MNRWLFNVYVLVFILFLTPSISSATTEYARQTGMECKECHVAAIGGGPLTKEGEKFLTEMKVKGLYRPLSNTQKVVRFFIGYIHLLTAIVWFGTIFYVHILLKPAYAARGLPKGELFLGWISIAILTVTGILLTIARIPSWKVLFTTRFGILLSIKIFLFLIMVSTAVIVTFVIGPKLKKKLKARWEGDISKGKQDLTSEELHSFDGKEGRPAFVAYKGKIYDVTTSKLWKDGSHARKHHAGRDLTDALKTAPHAEDKLLSMPEVGKLIGAGQKIPKPLPERVFYVFAYLNLAFVFLITFVIALWRWS
ncbi:MAG: CopD family protein [Nitrospirae bacterium]|nr:CopD family protein [Nitrospirota bacterium]MCL5421857.1 CopD family protein [Nitrospirota bacterium]